MFVINTVNSDLFVSDEFAPAIKKAKLSGAKYIEVDAANSAGYFTGIGGDPRDIKKLMWVPGTRVYNRNHGLPYATIKKAVRVLHAVGIPVEHCFDGNHSRSNSTVDNYEFDSQEELEKVSWAISALQWAGFQDPEVLCNFDPPRYAYTYEAKLNK